MSSHNNFTTLLRITKLGRGGEWSHFFGAPDFISLLWQILSVFIAKLNLEVTYGSSTCMNSARGGSMVAPIMVESLHHFLSTVYKSEEKKIICQN